MHHPKPNKTGSLALHITHVYSIFAAYIEGSSTAGAIENMCVCVCVCALSFVPVCFHRRVLNVKNHCESHIGNLKFFHL